MMRFATALSVFLATLTAVAESEFEKPVPILSSGRPIDVEHKGYAAPYVGDFDGDGRDDLLVGEYFTGRLRIYRNVGNGVDHRFDGFSLFLDGDRDGCVSPPSGTFRPQLVDFDGDGDTDIIAGNLYGDVVLFERGQDGKFQPGRNITKKNGERLRLGHTTMAYAFDWDDDGDLDLITGAHEGLFFVRNEGTRQSFEPADSEPLSADGIPIPAQGLFMCPTVVDWDNDGLADLLCGTKSGSVVWFRNVGTKEKPNLMRGGELIPAAAEGELRGEMARICVTDWNRDGRLDLVLGDHGEEFQKKLSDTEQSERRTAISQQSELFDQWSRTFRQYRQIAARLKSEPERAKLWTARMRDLRRTLGEVNSAREIARRRVESLTEDKQNHGRVWLFLRKP